ncbi:MAG: DUF559 domain-containing protein [Nitriliruptorales bacterium]
MPALSQRVIRLLRSQHGVVGRHQLLACGMSEGQIDGLVARGAFEVVLYGVYRLRAAPVPPEQPAMSAVLRCWPVARLTGPFVLGLLGIEGFSLRAPLHVLVKRNRRVSNVSFVVTRTTWALEKGPTARRLPIVDLGRVYMDTAPVISRRRLIVGVDSGRWRGAITLDRIRHFIRLDPRHPGSRILKSLLEEGVFDQESMGERALKPVLDGIEPAVEWGVWVAPDIRVDALWRDCRLVIEYDGRDDHGSVPHRAADAARDQRLHSLGYHVIHVTKEDLRHPEALLARILAVRDALLSRN